LNNDLQGIWKEILVTQYETGLTVSKSVWRGTWKPEIISHMPGYEPGTFKIGWNYVRSMTSAAINKVVFAAKCHQNCGKCDNAREM
jgi:hypothetical protein